MIAERHDEFLPPAFYPLLAGVRVRLDVRCVQDLTCVGPLLIHSGASASHIPGVAAIESNGRQYCSAANAPWDARFPGLFTIDDGTMDTAISNGPGLGEAFGQCFHLDFSLTF